MLTWIKLIMMKDIQITFSRGRCDKCMRDKYLLLVIDSEDFEHPYGICDTCLTEMINQILKNKILRHIIKTVFRKEIK